MANHKVKYAIFNRDEDAFLTLPPQREYSENQYCDTADEDTNGDGVYLYDNYNEPMTLLDEILHSEIYFYVVVVEVA